MLAVLEKEIPKGGLHESAAALEREEHPQLEELKDVEELTQEFKRLLVKRESVLDEEGIREKVEVLERWMESYRRGLSAAHKISTQGTALLEDVRNYLKLAAEEKLRLESEGGVPADKAQTEKTEELLKAAQHIDKMLPNVEQIFSAEEQEHEPA